MKKTLRAQVRHAVRELSQRMPAIGWNIQKQSRWAMADPALTRKHMYAVQRAVCESVEGIVRTNINYRVCRTVEDVFRDQVTQTLDEGDFIG